MTAYELRISDLSSDVCSSDLFDKTGTLTEGRPRLTDVVPAAGVDEQQLLAIAVAVEVRSDHPLATAIVRDGTERLAERTPPAATDVTAVTGKGIRATVGGAEVLIGKVGLFEGSGGVHPALLSEVNQLLASGRTAMGAQKRHGLCEGRWMTVRV